MPHLPLHGATAASPALQSVKRPSLVSCQCVQRAMYREAHAHAAASRACWMGWVTRSPPLTGLRGLRAAPDIPRVRGARAHRVQALRGLPLHHAQRPLEEPDSARAVHRRPLCEVRGRGAPEGCSVRPHGGTLCQHIPARQRPPWRCRVPGYRRCCGTSWSAAVAPCDSRTWGGVAMAACCSEGGGRGRVALAAGLCIWALLLTHRAHSRLIWG